MSEGGEPSAPATPGLIPLSYTTPWDAAGVAGLVDQPDPWRCNDFGAVALHCKTLRGSAVAAEDGSHRFVAQVTVYALALGVAPTQTTYETGESSERAALKELLSSLQLEVVLIQADALHTTQAFSLVPLQGGRRAFDGERQPENPAPPDPVPVPGQAPHPVHGDGSGEKAWRVTIWEMRAKEARDHIKANWPDISWIIEMITTTVTSRGHQVPRAHLLPHQPAGQSQKLCYDFLQRCSIENEWHWPRDTQLHDARRQLGRRPPT